MIPRRPGALSYILAALFVLTVGGSGCDATTATSGDQASEHTVSTKSRSTNVVMISGRDLVPMDVADDGAGGAVVLADEEYQPSYFRLSESGKLLWAFQLDKRAKPRRVFHNGDGFLVVGYEPKYLPEGQDTGAGFFLEVDVDGKPMRMRRLVGKKETYVVDLDRADGKMATLVAEGYARAVMMLRDDLSREWLFAIDPTVPAHLTAITAYKGGAVVSGEAEKACLVARFDPSGELLWSNRYEVGSLSRCTDVTVLGDMIYAGSTPGATFALIALRDDGSVAHATQTELAANGYTMLRGDHSVVVIGTGMMRLRGLPPARLFTRFSEGPLPDVSFALPIPEPLAGTKPMSHGGELAATAAGGREWYFGNLATGRILGVSSSSESWAEECGAFEQLDWNWRRVDVATRAYPLKRGEMAFELVDARLPSAAPITLQVEDHCTGVVKKPLPKTVEAPKMPDIPIGTMAKVPVDELEGIKSARQVWARVFRERKWGELERTVTELIDTGARFENGGWKMIDFERALTVGSDELSDLDEEAYFERIEHWKQAFPKSDRPTIQAAESLDALAWQSRGSGSGSSVTDEGWKSFEHYNTEIVRLLTPIVNRGTKDPSAYQLLVEVLGATGKDPMPVVRRAMKVIPEYHHVYEARLDFLRRGWGGTPEDVQAFLDEVDSALDPSIRDQVYARLAWYESWSNPVAFREVRIDRNRVQSGFEAIGKRFPKSTRDWYRYAAVMCALGDQAVARRIFADPRLAYEQSLADRYFLGWIRFGMARLWSESSIPTLPAGTSWDSRLFETRVRAGGREAASGWHAAFVDHGGSSLGLTTPMPVVERDSQNPRLLRLRDGLSWSVWRRGGGAPQFDVALASPVATAAMPSGIALAPSNPASVPRDALFTVRPEPVGEFPSLWVITSDLAGRPARPLFASTLFADSSDFDLMLLDRVIEPSLLAGAPVVDGDGKLVGIVVWPGTDSTYPKVETVRSILSKLPAKGK